MTPASVPNNPKNTLLSLFLFGHSWYNNRHKTGRKCDPPRGQPVVEVCHCFAQESTVDSPNPKGIRIMQAVEQRFIPYNGVKVFSTTKFREREMLGETISDWIHAHPEYEILDRKVMQSSDNEFHCLSIILFYHNPNER
jgi:hypothetical protein